MPRAGGVYIALIDHTKSTTFPLRPAKILPYAASNNPNTGPILDLYLCATNANLPTTLLHGTYSLLRDLHRSGLALDEDWPQEAGELWDRVGDFLFQTEEEWP